MRIEKLFRVLSVLVMVVTASFLFVSCSKEEQGSEVMISYYHVDDLTFTGSFVDGMDMIANAMSDYSKAIEGVLGGTYTDKEMDEEVMTACDAVYEKHKADYPKLKGTVIIIRNKTDLSVSDNKPVEETIKTYKYE